MKKKYIVRIVFILLIIPVIYLGVQLYFVFNNRYLIGIAVEYELSETIPSVGIAVRNETVINFDYSGELYYLVDNAERVVKDALLAKIFKSTAMAQQSSIAERTEKKADVLRLSKSAGEYAVMDIENIAKQEQTAYFELLDILCKKQLYRSEDVKNSLLLSINKMQIATGVPYNFDNQLSIYENFVLEVSQNIEAEDVITAPAGGYFVKDTDGGETLFEPSVAQRWNTSDLYDAIETAKKLSVSKSNVGKLILDYKWHYYCLVDERAAEGIVKEKAYKIIFSETGGTALNTIAVRIDKPGEDGRCLVDFLCDSISPSVTSLRYDSAQIVVRSYNGIRVSQSALRIVNGERGVYVKYGNVLRFKKITPLFEDKNYLLLPFEQSEENGVKLYDEIIVEGKNLYDGKIL